MLQEEERRLAGVDGKVLLNFLSLLASKGRIGQHYVEAILFGASAIKCW